MKREILEKKLEEREEESRFRDLAAQDWRNNRTYNRRRSCAVKKKKKEVGFCLVGKFELVDE